MRKIFTNLVEIMWLRILVLVVLILGTIGMSLFLSQKGAPLTANNGPGIIPFELAGNIDTANKILEKWGSEGQAIAKMNIQLDFLFLVIYSITFAYMCYLAARVFSDYAELMYSIGIVLMYGQVAAGIFDAIENLAMLKTINAGVATNPLPLIAAICAAIKFLLIISGLIYVWVGVLAWFGLKRLNKERNQKKSCRISS